MVIRYSLRYFVILYQTIHRSMYCNGFLAIQKLIRYAVSWGHSSAMKMWACLLHCQQNSIHEQQILNISFGIQFSLKIYKCITLLQKLCQGCPVSGNNGQILFKTQTSQQPKNCVKCISCGQCQRYCSTEIHTDLFEFI